MKLPLVLAIAWRRSRNQLHRNLRSDLNRLSRLTAVIGYTLQIARQVLINAAGYRPFEVTVETGQYEDSRTEHRNPHFSDGDSLASNKADAFLP